jgi:hypothetical protein
MFGFEIERIANPVANEVANTSSQLPPTNGFFAHELKFNGIRLRYALLNSTITGILFRVLFENNFYEMALLIEVADDLVEVAKVGDIAQHEDDLHGAASTEIKSFACSV